MTWEILLTNKAEKDLKKIKSSHLESNFWKLVEILRKNPYQNPPHFEKLKNNLNGLYSRRINVQHRLVYEVFESTKSIKILSLWEHYE